MSAGYGEGMISPPMGEYKAKPRFRQVRRKNQNLSRKNNPLGEAPNCRLGTRVLFLRAAGWYRHAIARFSEHWQNYECAELVREELVAL